ncbi:MAG: hypothetical protein QOJ15_11247, partial [Bradyrhizobium sp.]|nr:hypothetical protein [Bradyrhizobium sp.]
MPKAVYRHQFGNQVAPGGLP